jgi:glycosyltransferase involved in cell wall biosynthesis
MKLLIHSNFFAPSVGGVESAVESLARGLAEIRSADGKMEFTVTLVTQSARRSTNDEKFPFRVVRQPGIWTLAKLIRQADVIHVAGPALAPLAVAWCTGTPAVIEHHGYQATCLNGLLLQQPGAAVCPGYFLQRRYGKCLSCYAQETSWLRSSWKLLTMFPRRFFTRRVATNIAISQHVMTRQGLPRTQVVYYGIADPLKSSEQDSGQKSDGDLCFAYVGRFVWEKGVVVLLRAVALLQKEDRRFQIRLIGDGEQRPELEEFIQRENLRDRVTITGYLRGQQLAQELKAVDVVVMPSLCEETAGLSAIEQMMRGRLVIASAIGGLREIVSDSGLTFPAGDAAALADRMGTVLENPAQFRELSQKARKRSLELFQIGRMIEEHADIYRSIVRSGE